MANVAAKPFQKPVVSFVIWKVIRVRGVGHFVLGDLFNLLKCFDLNTNDNGHT